MTACDCCHNTDELHEMTKCSGCGRLMCPKCLYLPTLASPKHCPYCRQRTLLERCRDHLDGCSHGYPDELWDDLCRALD